MPDNYFELFPEQEQRSRREHAALLDAMTRGDGAAARAVMEEHVSAAGQALGGWLAGLAAEHDPGPPAPDASAPLTPRSRLACSMRSMLARSSGEVNDRSSALSA